MSGKQTTITFLGTSSVTPGPGHDTASLIINGTHLVDTGWYSAIKMLSYGLSPMDLEYVFITHCHHDHYMALPQLLFYLRMRRQDRPDRPPLNVVGPAADIARVVRLSREFLQTERFPDVECVPTVIGLEPGDHLEASGLRVETCASRHAVPGLVYRFNDPSTGASIVVSGDTAYHPPIAELAAGADLLVHEASFGARPAPDDNRCFHSGVHDAVRVAEQANVARLALVHCAEAAQHSAVVAASERFADTFWPTDGETVCVP